MFQQEEIEMTKDLFDYKFIVIHKGSGNWVGYETEEDAGEAYASLPQHLFDVLCVEDMMVRH